MPRRGRATPEWRGPFLIILGAVLLVEIAMVLLDMGPEPLLVAALGAFVGAAVWCVRSLSQTTVAPKSPPRAVAAPRTVGADRRVRALRTGILFGRGMSGHTDRLHEMLVELIDDQLIHAHGIDRAADPAAAASIIGPKLTTLVSDPSTVDSVADTKELNRIVTLIEQI